jgi:hypothetical protein
MNFPDPTLPPPLDQFGALACFLSGSVYPFAPETLDELYPRRFSYFGDVFWSVFKLRLEGLILRGDAREILLEALRSDVGGGGAH